MEHLDKLAEEAVREALKELRERGERPHGKTVPPEAHKLLLRKARNRLAPADAERRVALAIARLKERKDIKAPATPRAEWALIEPADKNNGPTPGSGT
jgi:hypothetical protein